MARASKDQDKLYQSMLDGRLHIGRTLLRIGTVCTILTGVVLLILAAALL
ncbi:MAG: hypothetical protein AAF442_02870 [Pseudomonadota bacterium]